MPLRWVVMLGMTCTRSEGWTVCTVFSWSFSKTSVGLFNPLILLPGLHIFLTWDFCVHCTSSALYGTQRPLLIAVPHIPQKQQTQQNIKPISSPKKHAAQKPKSLQESVEWCDLSSSEALLRGWHKGPTLSQVGLELGIPQVLGFGKRRWMMLVIFLEWGSVPNMGDMSAYAWTLKILRRLSAWVLIWNTFPFSRLLGNHYIKQTYIFV